MEAIGLNSNVIEEVDLTYPQIAIVDPKLKAPVRNFRDEMAFPCLFTPDSQPVRQIISSEVRQML